MAYKLYKVLRPENEYALQYSGVVSAQVLANSKYAQANNISAPHKEDLRQRHSAKIQSQLSNLDMQQGLSFVAQQAQQDNSQSYQQVADVAQQHHQANQQPTDQAEFDHDQAAKDFADALTFAVDSDELMTMDLSQELEQAAEQAPRPSPAPQPGSGKRLEEEYEHQHIAAPAA